MPKLTVEGVGEFAVPQGKRLVLALEDEAHIDQLHACGGNARCTTCRVEFVAGEPERMTVAEKNVLAARGLTGAGWSSPIVYEGRVYLTTSVPLADNPNHDQSLRALCLDAATGKLVWDSEVFREDGVTAPRPHGKNSHASPTPLIDGQRLYVH